MTHPRDRWLPVIYAAAIFTSAFLLFQIQPLISKRILPWLGGSPAVWTTCLLFFQTVLFAGYAYAHWSNARLKPRQQALVHAALIVTALLLMRVIPSDRWEPTGVGHPIPQILFILLMSIGLPYFVLSATGPLLQAWFARSFPGRIPYRLYALSNVGSLLALVSYPFFFEPTFNLPGQARLWTVGFFVYAVLCVLIAWKISARQFSPKLAPESQTSSQEKSANDKQNGESLRDSLARPHPALYARWLFLAGYASVMLIATTNQISVDIAVMPLLWVVPLALYLITFIIVFDRPAWYRAVPVALFAIVTIYAAALLHHFGVGDSFVYDIGTPGRVASHFADSEASPPVVHFTTVHFLTANFLMMFAVCLMCHGEIVRTRPAPQYLTSFYLMISAGGALGGIFATLIAPLLFNRYYEWDFSVYLACIAAVVVVGRACVVSVNRRASQTQPRDTRKLRHYALVAGTVIVVLFISLSVLVDVGEFLGSRMKDARWAARDFFGTLTVQQYDSDDDQWRHNVLFHGTTEHGSQYTNEARRREHTTYYGEHSGVGRAIEYFQKHLPAGELRVAVVGLGTGALASYLEPGESITYYEINPTVINLAENGEGFTYLRDCRARGAHCDIRLGDARLTLQREQTTKQNSSYHVIALDAFSGDSVPVHLLTIQAFELYLTRLAAGLGDDGKQAESGAIAVHISNHYLDLEPVIRSAALHFKLLAICFHTPSDPAHNVYNSDWMVLTRNAALAAELGKVADPIDISRPPVTWTDDRSSLFEILR